MKNKPLFKHDLIIFLRTFSQKELKRFSLYLASDFFSTRKALLILYNELINFHPLYTQIDCTKESLYKRVYPGLKYNGGTMRDLLSSLYIAAADFITTEAIRKKNDSRHITINELRERGLSKQAFKLLEDHIQDEACIKNIDSEYFLNRYNLLIEKVNLNMIFRFQSTQKNISRLFEEVKNSELSILLFAILETTANYSNFILIEERFHENKSEDFMNDTIKELQNSGLIRLVKQQPDYGFVAEVYIAMLDALSKRGKFKQYKIYRDLVKKHLSKFSADEVSMHYSKLISCCILGSKYGKNKAVFDSELFDLYYNFLEKGLYRNNKTQFIPSNLYRTIILHAIRMNRLSWLLKVINRFINDIQPEDRENMRQYAMSNYYYASGRSGKAIEAIGKVNITQFIFKYDIYNLKLRIYYEERQYNAAIELIHSYRQFLSNDKLLPASLKMFYRTFMKYTSKLIAISDGSKKYEAGLEIRRLEKENCVYKDWLAEKFSLFGKTRRKYSIAG
jgi:hypothetical protein